MNLYTERALRSHIVQCGRPIEPRNQAINNYTNTSFNHEINAGNLNPHQYIPNADYLSQLHYFPSLDDQLRMQSQNPPAKEEDTVDPEPNVDELEDNNDVTFDNLDFEDDEDDDDEFIPSANDTHPSDDTLPRNVFQAESALPSMYLDISMRYAQMKDKEPPPDKKAPPRFQYKNTMSKVVVALGQLLLLVKRHKGTKSLYSDLLDFIFLWSTAYPDIFILRPGNPKWTRQGVIDHLGEVFQTKDLVPVRKHVKLSDNRIVTIPVTDFGALVRDILDDPRVLADISPGIDPTTWRPKKSQEELHNDPDAIIGEKETGYLYEAGIKLHCPETTQSGRRVLPLPCLQHLDQTHTDLFGHLTAIPNQYCPAMVSIEGQMKNRAWRCAAFIPNLAAGKGSDGKKTGQSITKLEDLHKCLNVAFSSFQEYYEEGGILWEDPSGEEVLLKHYLQHTNGDNKGAGELTNHYGCWQARCLIKDCKCDKKGYTKFPSRCKVPEWSRIIQCTTADQVFDYFEECNLVTYRDLSRAKGDADYAKFISKHMINNAFDWLPLADEFMGIIGMTPQDFLHMMGGGMYKHWIIANREVIGENTKQSAKKGILNKLFANIRHVLYHNSERDLPRMSNRNGFFNVASLTSDEVRGNFIGMVVMMHTTYGQNLMKPHFDAAGINFKDLKRTCLLILAWERFYLSPQKRTDVLASFYATQRLQSRIIKHIPREERKKDEKREGSRGYMITKFHGMLLVASIMLRLGCLKAVDTAKNEQLHKDFVKNHYQQTQRIPGRFCTQIASGDYERLLLEKMQRHIQSFLPDEVKHLSEKKARHVHQHVNHNDQFFEESDDEDSCEEEGAEEEEEEEEEEAKDGEEEGTATLATFGSEHLDDVELSGRFTYNIRLDRFQRRDVSHKWTSTKRRKLDNSNPSSFIGKVLSDYHLKYCRQYKKSFKDKISFECFTRAKISGTLYRAIPNWRGKEWYDWAVVKFPKTNASVHRSNVGETDKVQCIGRIITFFRHCDTGIPTYSLVEQQDKSWEEIQSGPKDTTTYVMLHCQDRAFSYSDLQSMFIYKFKMTALTSMYVLPISCIVGPLAVVPNFLSHKEVSSTNFMAILPRHKQAPFFTQYIHSDDAQFDFDMDTPWESDSDEEEEEEEEEEEGDDGDINIECDIEESEESDASDDEDEYAWDEFDDEEDEEDDSDSSID